MYTVVFESGKRVMFSKADYLLSFLLRKCPKMQLRTFALIIDWINDDTDLFPFHWIPFYITKE